MCALSALKCLRFSFVIGFLSGPIALSQIQPSSLTDALQNAEGVSTVRIGRKGAPVGYQGGYPVNTLVFPDGHVEYRVESGIFRGPVWAMEEMPPGTALKIASVDIKDDRVELKVNCTNNCLLKITTAGIKDDRTVNCTNHCAGRLKFMFGPGWQVHWSNAGVLAEVQKCLTMNKTFPSQEQNASGPSATFCE